MFGWGGVDGVYVHELGAFVLHLGGCDQRTWLNEKVGGVMACVHQESHIFTNNRVCQQEQAHACVVHRLPYFVSSKSCERGTGVLGYPCTPKSHKLAVVLLSMILRLCAWHILERVTKSMLGLYRIRCLLFTLTKPACVELRC